MVNCRYVGGDCSEVGEREFDTVGQRATFSEELFSEVLLGGAAFITERDFAKVGFTDLELDTFGPCGMRIDPTPEFVEKMEVARQFYLDTRRLVLERGALALAGVSE